jgi:hypothetical protein
MRASRDSDRIQARAGSTAAKTRGLIDIEMSAPARMRL